MNKISEDQIFQGRDFSCTDLSDHLFTNCTFQKCNFTECLLRNAKFVSCTFKACNLNSLKIEGCRLQDVLFEECKMTGIQFYTCEKNFFSIKAKNSFLQYCNFSHLNLKKTSFYGSKLKECYFSETILIEVDFKDTDLLG
ncbi:MAG: pentapeptide repeat-containing protein, partial [Verrucomicrobia bacterium]|nr:pentapeptide repeat-containing protein [Verrucomicrobiota bacterium]